MAPYAQDFSKLTGTVTTTDKHLTDIPEVYAEAEFPGFNYSQPMVYPNDGSLSSASYYHFGPSSGTDATDRAYGGIGGFANGSTTGIGYVGIRLKNAATVPIKNLDIKYALEHWYNSTFNTAAEISVSYMVSPLVDPVNNTYAELTSLVQTQPTDRTWVDLPTLKVVAPSTATSVGARDGNAASNRRVVSTTVDDINLQPGQEVMIRWAYVLNSNTNGNGFGIDDVVITPQTNVFYSNTTGNLNDVGTWTTDKAGTGTHPANFITANQTFYVQSSSSTSATNRIPENATWTVSGTNSKIVVGTSTTPASLTVDFNRNIAGTIDVSPDSCFLHRRTNGPAFTFGTLANTSTVEYNSNSTVHTLPAKQYGNLKITGNNADRNLNRKALGGDVVVTGALSIGAGSNLSLGSYSLTVLSGNISAASTGYVVANGSGSLRVRVPRASASLPGAQITFPVGTSATSYSPVTLQQTSTVSDDVFEVRMLDKVYKNYSAAPSFAGTTPVVTEAVNKTWLISKEVPANPATVNMTLQWNASEVTSKFDATRAHINHYTNGAWDVYNTETGAAASGTAYVATRSNIDSFSPFSVSSRVDGALPVELVFFNAKRTGSAVATTWATANEQNNDYFTVERSATGTEFVAIGEVRGAGSSSKRLNYAFEDKAPLMGTAYYRLRQTDTDGKTTFSPAVTVQGGTTLFMTAVPNPNTGKFDIWVPTAEVTAVEVFSVVGARVRTEAVAGAGSRLSFDLSAQPAGVYLVRLQTAAGTRVARVVKQ
ncbi:MAG TPA: T9SS type A sorting domain-containing protein [Hymenobacter sp.]